ncbi:bone morphogenetic protein 3 [Trichonephila clavata]|uniref:Bone morphogenetic protein 3 n=1 Tax=Trichonephila clavata TaxID=2740835 RepID=A0A8X6H9B2_TRICU|nr:bone morphogenetic protein 3 [Trichonephila clavata]
MWYVLLLVSVASCVSESIWPVENRILQLRTAAPRSDSPPSYMVHLYNRYRKGRMPYSAANTVRSFFPTPGRLGNDDLLVFNLTGVHPTEYVERVDFHLQSKSSFKQNSRLDPKKSQMEVDILDLSRPQRPKIETIPLTRAQSGSWQTLDITDSIIACLEGEAEQHHLVGVAIKGPEITDVSEVVSQPFLVLFSEDDDHLDIEELGRDANLIRRKREILNNELPDYPSEKVDGSLAEVQARLKYKPLDLAIAPHTEARKVSKTEMEKHRKRRRRRRRKDKRLPFAWGKSWWRKSDLKNNPDYEGDDEEDEDEEEGVDDQLLCQKKKMVVSFAEIGWGDWIISPKSFDASYCSGVCPQPLKKSIQSSNHATIQGLIHSLGMKKNIPELCCVPSSLAPVSLLYYDQNHNIVLKSFPDMSVQNCSCR